MNIIENALKNADQIDFSPEGIAKRIEDMKKAGWKPTVTNYACKVCRDTGWIIFDKDDIYTMARPCECQIRARSLSSLAMSGLGNLTERYRFDNFKTSYDWQKKMKDTAELYANHGFQRWMFFGGQTGAGKTHLCTAAAVAMLNQNKSVRYFRWREEGSVAKRLVNDLAYDDYMEPYMDCDVLYIDDLFKSKASYMNGERVYSVTAGDVNLAFLLLDYRYSAQKQTIISSEMNLETIAAAVDKSIAGRIEEMAKDYSIEIAEDDARNYRKRA